LGNHSEKILRFKVESASSKPTTVPSHIAIIMDGNGRWAHEKKKPRFMGHKRGMDRVRSTVEACVEKNIQALTLFAFSTENWHRPEEEVSYLMDLFLAMMKSEVKKLHKNSVRVRVIGDRGRFSGKLQKAIAAAEELTKNNNGLSLNIAANYGGHMDITEAVRTLAHEALAGRVNPDDITQEMVRKQLALSELPEPDLLIRTGGEKRISNFLLWQLAYCEFYFTDSYWPDFNKELLSKAIDSFSSRQRRFGYTGEQVVAGQ